MVNRRLPNKCQTSDDDKHFHTSNKLLEYRTIFVPNNTYVFFITVLHRIYYSSKNVQKHSHNHFGEKPLQNCWSLASQSVCIFYTVTTEQGHLYMYSRRPCFQDISQTDNLKILDVSTFNNYMKNLYFINPGKLKNWTLYNFFKAIQIWETLIFEIYLLLQYWAFWSNSIDKTILYIRVVRSNLA